MEEGYAILDSVRAMLFLGLSLIPDTRYAI